MTERTDVELRHLRAIVAVADSETFTTAAARLRTTQPTLSRTIAQLEAILGTRLVARTTRSVTLTRNGQRLVDHARTMLDALDEALSSLESVSTPPLRIGAAWAGFGPDTVPLIHEWRQTQEQVIDIVHVPDPVRELHRGAIDAAVIREAPSRRHSADGLQRRRLTSERLVAAMSTHDQRATEPEVTLRSLMSTTIALCTTSSTITERMLHDHGDTPRTITVGGTEEWLTLIALGDVVGITSASTAHNHQSPDVAFRPIADAPLVEVSLVSPVERPHPALGPFEAFAHTYFSRQDHTI